MPALASSCRVSLIGMMPLLAANYQRATSQIRDTFHRVEDISIAHGAELLPRDSPAFKR